jgi:hypothetical protein
MGTALIGRLLGVSNSRRTPANVTCAEAVRHLKPTWGPEIRMTGLCPALSWYTFSEVSALLFLLCNATTELGLVRSPSYRVWLDEDMPVELEAFALIKDVTLEVDDCGLGARRFGCES